MRLHGWFEDAFGSRRRVQVLRYLLASPRTDHTLTEIARATRMRPSAASFALRFLVDQGFVDGRRLGNSNVYQLPARQSTELLRLAFDAEASLSGAVEKALRRAAGRGTSVVLFGSAARREQGPASDLDVLVVASRQSVAELEAERIREALRRVAPLRPRVLALSGGQFAAKRDMAWIRGVLIEGRRIGGPPLERWL